MKKAARAAPRTRLTEHERARMVQIDTLLQAYVQARTRHRASYPEDLVSVQVAASDLARTLAELADLGPTSRELLGLAHQWEATRSRHAARLTAADNAEQHGQA